LATRSFDRSAALMRRSLYWPVRVSKLPRHQLELLFSGIDLVLGK
jgi:hypothetical protein